mmetsp:Transcript_3835/g.8649  ORF Transcript_3835/g.8649 Transcript_3835/m.8649 type:complete len:287 (-) Transcript_3835:1619-2479(-)
MFANPKRARTRSVHAPSPPNIDCFPQWLQTHWHRNRDLGSRYDTSCLQTIGVWRILERASSEDAVDNFLFLHGDATAASAAAGLVSPLLPSLTTAAAFGHGTERRFEEPSTPTPDAGGFSSSTISIMLSSPTAPPPRFLATSSLYNRFISTSSLISASHCAFSPCIITTALPTKLGRSHFLAASAVLPISSIFWIVVERKVRIGQDETRSASDGGLIESEVSCFTRWIDWVPANPIATESRSIASLSLTRASLARCFFRSYALPVLPGTGAGVAWNAWAAFLLWAA